MKRRQAIVATLGATTALAGGPARALPAAPGQAVAWPEVALLDGSRFGPAQAAGRALVVVFWSTTCPYCRRHNQHVEKLHRAAAGRRLAVLGVARDRDVAAVRRYVDQQGYTFPVTTDQAPMAAVLAARRVIPLTVTIDRAGRLLQVIPGEMFEADVLELLQLADKEVRT
ncbi:MAG: TlpA disulfide reductase family protein [Rubrivivax sp.]|nr:TlpA disulfide reductase family protein [Rubrivivax sp.]